jgi:carboxypeptidase Q
MKRLVVAVLAGLLSPFVIKAQEDSVMIRQIVEDILVRGKAYENLRFICKKIGPRLSGSPQGAKAVTETARMMRELGADTVYLQECMVPRWVRKGRDTASLIMANGKGQPLRITALGNSEGTSAKGLKATVVEVKDFDELELLKDQVKGKIVFYNHPMNPRFIETFRAYGAAGQYRGQGASRAAKYGAVGVIVRSLASNPDDHPHTGAMRYDSAYAKIPAVAISTNDADLLSSALKKKMVSQVYIKAECGMQGEVLSHNIIGEIRGTEFPDEIITVGGHIDSWDLAEGAHDDGAGCVQSMEVIRVFKDLGIRPKRTIRAVMFQNEENGLRGGTKYAELAANDKKKYILAIESDAGGFTPRGIGVSNADTLREKKVKDWAPLFARYGVKVESGGGGADIGPMRKLGTTLASLSPDSQRYFDIHHAATDVFEAVSRRELHLGAGVMASLIYLVDKYGN